MSFHGDWGKHALPAQGCCPTPGPPHELQGPAPHSGGTGLLRPFLQGPELPAGGFPHVQEERKGGFCGVLAIVFLRLFQPGVFPVS